MTDLNTAHRARITLAAINRALTPIGYDAFPGPDLDALPDVSAPTDQEIHDAITKVKGDVGKSAEIQALAARAWLASTGTAKGLEHGAWATAWETCKAALPTISDEIRERYADVAQRLQDAATGPYKAVADLDQLDLATLSTPLALKAGEAIQDYREATALHAGWRSIWVTLQGGAPAHWSEMARPTNDEYAHARNATPQLWPAPDVWQVARKGWKGELAESLRDAQENRARLQRAAVDTEHTAAQTSRRRALKGGGLKL